MKKILFYYDSRMRYGLQKNTILQLSLLNEYKIIIIVAINSDEDYLFYSNEKKYFENVKILFTKNFFVNQINKFLSRYYNQFDNEKNKISTIGFLITFALEYLILLIDKIKASYYFRKNTPNIMVIPLDREVGFTSQLIILCRRKHIKIILLQVHFLNINFTLVNRSKSLMNISPLKDFIKLKQKYGIDNFYVHEDKVYHYLKLPKLIAAKYLNLQLFNPWQWGSNSDVLLVDSELTRDTLKLHKSLNDNIVVTGNDFMDRLYQNSITTDNSRLSGDKKQLLISMPHLSEHKFCNVEEHMLDIKKLFNQIEDLNLKITLSFHPRADKKIKNFAISILPKNCFITDEKINDILGKYDLFMGWWSGTIFWSFFLNKKTILLNYYGISNLGCELIENKICMVNKSDLIRDSIIKCMLSNNENNQKNYFLPKSSINYIHQEINKNIR
tara:strand:- start:2558 stop:3886 length:1329 start_codon:yes stop_codon:yes gene_type:complete